MFADAPASPEKHHLKQAQSALTLALLDPATQAENAPHRASTQQSNFLNSFNKWEERQTTSGNCDQVTGNPSPTSVLALDQRRATFCHLSTGRIFYRTKSMSADMPFASTYNHAVPDAMQHDFNLPLSPRPHALVPLPPNTQDEKESRLTTGHGSRGGGGMDGGRLPNGRRGASDGGGQSRSPILCCPIE